MPARQFDGERLRSVRRMLDCTQKQVAEAVGVSDAAVASWEAGKSAPDPEKLPAIAKFLDQDMDGLFPREGAPDLADLRCDAGYSQLRTKDITGTLSAGPVANAERGKRRLSSRFVGPLARAYGVRVEQLLAAQDRSFGIEVPEPTAPKQSTPPPSAPGAPGPDEPALPRTVAEKITYLLDETFMGDPPSDGQVAARGNARTGRSTLTEGLVRDLRTGAASTADGDVLEALAAALDAPPLFFTSDDAEVHRIVSSVRMVRGLAGMAARGGTSALPSELMDYIADAVAEIARTEFPGHPDTPAR